MRDRKMGVKSQMSGHAPGQGCPNAIAPTSRLYSTLKVDMPGAEDLNRDSRMEAALGWCCCLEAKDGEREPVP